MLVRNRGLRTALVFVAILNTPAVDAQSPSPRFEAASVKPAPQAGSDIEGLGDVRILPGRLVAENAQLRYFIQNAYGVKPFQLLGGPSWIASAHYDIDANAAGNPNHGQMLLMMQSLLQERFALRVHHETKQMPVYDLVLAGGRSKLPEPRQGTCSAQDPNAGSVPPAPGQPECGRVLMMMSPAGAQLRGAGVSMAELVRVLSNVLAVPVIDKTGFSQTFDVHLEFTPDETLGGLPIPPGPSNRAPGSPDPYGNLFAAMPDQLGLKLQAAKGPVDIIVIDSIERPSAN